MKNTNKHNITELVFILDRSGSMSEQAHRLSPIGAKKLTPIISVAVKRISKILGEGHPSPCLYEIKSQFKKGVKGGVNKFLLHHGVCRFILE